MPVSPRSDRIAIGYQDKPVVDLYDVSSMTRIHPIDNADMAGGNLQTVAWSPSGERLFAAGTFQHGGRFVVRSWDRAGDGKPVDIDAADDAVLSLATCRSGVLIATADPSFGILDEAGKHLHWRDG
ncbi:MAG: hypothetical protein WDN31_23145 [Hyphomicrobium sp.]